MSTKEIERANVLSQLQQKFLKQKQAAESLGLTTRHLRRLLKAYKQNGPLALISKKRGNPSNHQLSLNMKEFVLSHIIDRYSDFGPTLVQEKLQEEHNIKISVWAVRALMISRGLWKANRIRKKRVYQLRERRSCEGELVQIDGSPHDWFEGRSQKCSLLLGVDDATGKIQVALFAPSESTWSYFSLVKLYLKTHGKPKALYSDKHGVFKVNKKDALSGDGMTQFGRAMKELEIRVIFAHSPQAKGRIERSNRTLQDRLVKELRLRKISSIEAANEFLPTFIKDYNRRFAVIPIDLTNAHTQITQGQNPELICTIQEDRHLSKNLTFQYKNTIYQIKTEREEYALRKAKVRIYEKEDASISVLYKNKPLDYTTYQFQQKQGEIADCKTLNAIIDSHSKVKLRYKPPMNHPWRSYKRKNLVPALSSS